MYPCTLRGYLWCAYVQTGPSSILEGSSIRARAREHTRSAVIKLLEARVRVKISSPYTSNTFSSIWPFEARVSVRNAHSAHPRFSPPVRTRHEFLRFELSTRKRLSNFPTHIHVRHSREETALFEEMPRERRKRLLFDRRAWCEPRTRRDIAIAPRVYTAAVTVTPVRVCVLLLSFGHTWRAG